MNSSWWRALCRLPSRAWQALRQVPGLLAAPRPDPTQQAARIIAIQRTMVFPTKVVILSIVGYYLYSSGWMEAMTTHYGSPYNKIPSGYEPYVIINIFAFTTFFVVRRFSLGFAQGMVFVVGLVDGLFLAGLTLLTDGFNSSLYWGFAAMIVVNAICIPLATPQLALNLLLTGFYLAAGMIERNAKASTDGSSTTSILQTQPPVPASTNTQNSIGGTNSPAQKVPTDPRAAFTTASVSDRDLRFMIMQLRRPLDPVTKYVRGKLTSSTRQQILALTEGQLPDAALKETLVAELNRIFAPPRTGGDSGDSIETPTPSQAVKAQLAVLWLLTFCCYGVQLLAARQRLAVEEQQEFLSRSGQLRAAGRLAAEIAHKVKNPLGIINNAAFSLQKALREGRNVSPQEVQIIQEEVERSDRIITQIMGYATLSEGRVEKLDVEAELGRAIQNVFPAAAGFAVEVERQIAVGLPALWMQPAHFNEVFVNILQNAREALNGVGQITITAREVPDQGVEVTVEDNGPGIPPDKLERIFEPYFSMREKGTGLGLSIVRHNVELYAGTVRAESELGHGARFRVFFPARSSLEAGS